MKKIIILSLLLLAAAPFPACAQAKVSRQVNERARNEISASYGAATIMQIAYGLGGVFGTVFTGGGVTVEKLRCSGAISVSYYRGLNKWLSVGVDLAGEHLSLTFKNKNTGNLTENSAMVISPMLTAKGNWLRRNHFDIYSRISAGVSMLNNPIEKQFSTTFATQISPIGLEFGGINFRGFLEGGMGTQGIFIGGLKYRF